METDFSLAEWMGEHSTSWWVFYQPERKALRETLWQRLCYWWLMPKYYWIEHKIIAWLKGKKIYWQEVSK